MGREPGERCPRLGQGLSVCWVAGGPVFLSREKTGMPPSGTVRFTVAQEAEPWLSLHGVCSHLKAGNGPEVGISHPEPPVLLWVAWCLRWGKTPGADGTLAA